ncbi:unnamed protein product, partial [Prorocentrum cordatum]
PFWLKPFLAHAAWAAASRSGPCRGLRGERKRAGLAAGPIEPQQTVSRMRLTFSDSIEVIQFDPECRTPGQGSVLAVVIASPRAARRKTPSPPPAKVAGGGASEAPLLHATVSRGGSWPVSSSSSPSPWTGRSHCRLSNEPVDSDAGEAAEESVFAMAAQRRHIRRSVTANLGPGLPPHVLPAVMTSKILSRRRGAGQTGIRLSADGSTCCSAVDGVRRVSSCSTSSSD